jgi:adenine-specific DNA-methyltransferase
MALVDALLDKISDENLRQALREQVDQLLGKQSFGLVYQQHKPESVELHKYAVRRNCKVRVKSEDGNALYIVDNVKKGIATIRSLAEQPEFTDISVDELVVVREFGDPIYPGLVSTGSVQRGGDKPAHIVINAENFHALETLLYTHEGKVDAIYIDPPYNTRDNDWKYNNDYVDSDDVYRHSKWLAMMERRLRLAGRLLNAANSVMIVTIDEKESVRLGMLLQQVFPEARVQAVSVNINPAAVARNGMFGRSDEYAYFVMFGSAGPQPMLLGPEWITTKGRTHRGQVRWDLLRKSGSSPLRAGHPGTFYPVFIANDGSHIHSIGDILQVGQDRRSVQAPPGTVAVFPIRKDGSEGRWAVGPTVARGIWADGYLRLGKFNAENTPIYYLAQGERAKVEDGMYEVLGRAADGSIITDALDTADRLIVPGTQWHIPSHDSTQYGSRLLQRLLPDRKFPFPKSLYAVEDCLRFFIADKPNAIVLDFFAGSGTTMHAVARLNHQDGGRRQSICVTNNEVSAQEAEQLRAQGLQPGDEAWERLGICEYITKPRVRAAITGVATSGAPIPGNYKFVDEFKCSVGFEENAEFFNLTYEDPDAVGLGRSFEAIAALLWLKAGASGARIEHPNQHWALPDGATYGVLFDTDRWRDFVNAVTARSDEIKHIFVVTGSNAVFQQIVSELPTGLGATQLYDDYLRTFEINTKGRA